MVKQSAVFELDFDAKQTRLERADAVDQIGGCRRNFQLAVSIVTTSKTWIKI